jgi:hypothetical protein
MFEFHEIRAVYWLAEDRLLFKNGSAPWRDLVNTTEPYGSSHSTSVTITKYLYDAYYSSRCLSQGRASDYNCKTYTKRPQVWLPLLVGIDIFLRLGLDWCRWKWDLSLVCPNTSSVWARKLGWHRRGHKTFLDVSCWRNGCRITTELMYV